MGVSFMGRKGEHTCQPIHHLRVEKGPRNRERKGRNAWEEEQRKRWGCVESRGSTGKVWGCKGRECGCKGRESKCKGRKLNGRDVKAGARVVKVTARVVKAD
jgi:hypothetical protein